MKTPQHYIFRIILTLLTLICFFPKTVSAQNLKQHQWQYRVLILKTNSTQSKTYKTQIIELKNASEELCERKLILYQVVGETYELTDFTGTPLKKLGQISESFKKSYLNSEEDFEIRLIGLDGGTKLHQYKLLDTNELFKIIDVMPMRRAELSNN